MMMNFDELMSLNTLLVSNALLVAAVTIALLRFQRMNRPPAQPGTPDTPAEAESDLEKRIDRLQEIADGLLEKEARLQDAARREFSYEAAARLARQGASAEDLSERCGLNRGEAELLARLHAVRGSR